MTKRITFATAIWGEWYADIFCTLLARTLVASGNFPKLSRRGNADYSIYTDAATAKHLRESVVWPSLVEIIRLNVYEIEIDYDNPILAHHHIWTQARMEATKAGSAIVFIAPDTMWADGSIGRIADLFDAGYGGIFIPGFRVAFDSFLPAMQAAFGANGDDSIALSPREMMARAMEHMHPLKTVFLRGSPIFPDFSENIVWPVGEDGFVLREPMAHSLIAVDPNEVEVDQFTLPQRANQFNKIYWITGSDDILFVSLGPLARDLDWFDTADAVDAGRIGLRSIMNNGPHVDLLMRRKFRFHRGITDERAWRAVERSSDLFMHRVTVARETIKIFHRIDFEGCTRAAALVAAALFSRNLAHASLFRDQVTVFCPADANLPDINEDALQQFLGRSRAHDLRRFILAHVVGGHYPMETLARLDGGHVLPGGKLTIGRDQHGLTVNGVSIVKSDIACGKHVIHIVEAPLVNYDLRL